MNECINEVPTWCKEFALSTCSDFDPSECATSWMKYPECRHGVNEWLKVRDTCTYMCGTCLGKYETLLALYLVVLKLKIAIKCTDNTYLNYQAIFAHDHIHLFSTGIVIAVQQT